MDVGQIGAGTASRVDPLVPTVFHEPWWLTAATDGQFQEVRVTVGGCVVGRFPFVLGRLPGRQMLCHMPELTHFLGPAIDVGSGSAANRALKHDGILRDLLQAMPRTSGFYQKLHRRTVDTLVFQEQSYRTAVQFTYEIEPQPAASIWAAMRDKTRNVIRRAEQKYDVVERPDPAWFAALYRANLAGRGVDNHYRRITPVCDAALLHNRGRIIAARDEQGRAVAAIFYVWDGQVGYYLLTTRGEQAGNGAVSLLIWDAIRDCAARGLVFDFDGVATPGSRVFYTGFGGRVVPRYIVSRYSLAHRIAGRLSNPFRMPTRHLFQW